VVSIMCDNRKLYNSDKVSPRCGTRQEVLKLSSLCIAQVLWTSALDECSGRVLWTSALDT